MTKRQRRLMYLEAARAVLEDGRSGIYLACHPAYQDDTEELDLIAEDIDGAVRLTLPADLRAMLLILAATI